MENTEVKPTNTDLIKERYWDAHEFINDMKAFAAEQKGECFFVPKEDPKQLSIGFEAHYEQLVDGKKVPATKYFTIRIPALWRKPADIQVDWLRPLEEQNLAPFTNEQLQVIKNYADAKLALHKAEAEYVKLFTGQACSSPEIYENTSWGNPVSNVIESDASIKAKMGTINNVRSILSNPFAGNENR
jgi:hypothetical protein